MPFFKQLLRLLPLLLLGPLASCTVYDHFFHPHRIGNPPMTAAAKAKARAAEKARHKGQSTSLKPAEATATAPGTEASAPGTVPGAADVAAAPAPDARALNDKNKAVEDMLGHTYNTKTGLLKRSAWQKAQANSHKLHHYDTRPLTPRAASRDARKMRKHPKGPGKEKTSGGKDYDKPMSDEDLAPAAEPAPRPDPTQPAAPKAAKTSKAVTSRPAKAAAPKPAPSRPAAPKPAAPRPAAPKPAKKAKERPTEGMAPLPAAAPVREAAPPVEKAKKEKKTKKPKRDANGFQADPTQPDSGN